MILPSKLLPMGNNLEGKMIIARVINFFRQIIARVTKYKELLPCWLLLKIVRINIISGNRFQK